MKTRSQMTRDERSVSELMYSDDTMQQGDNDHPFYTDLKVYAKPSSAEEQSVVDLANLDPDLLRLVEHLIVESFKPMDLPSPLPCTDLPLPLPSTDLVMPSAANGSPVSDAFVKRGEAPQVEVRKPSKTDCELEKRRKNNKASRDSRLKKKLQFLEMQQRIGQLEKENDELKLKLQLAIKRCALTVREA